MKKRLTILGATGSIGDSTLDVVARHPDRFEVYALTANTDWQRMLELCQRFTPRFAVMADANAAEQLQGALSAASIPVEVLSGKKALQAVSSDAEIDLVMSAIVGAAGLLPTLAAVNAGKIVCLANKEALVMSGALFMSAVRDSGATLLPIDSEHNAIFQCLPISSDGTVSREGVRRILLTASGGPFHADVERDLSAVTPAQAIAHPNWDMGKKISVDSATLMNKGLEVIEARWLFDVSPEHIDVVVHKQSIIHSMVEYADGSVLAQLGSPDMRTPIAHAMAWPTRIESGAKPLDLFEIGRFDFTRPDLARFPCLRLAFEAAKAGLTAPAVLNAANEVAVDAFLREQIRFTDIPRLIEQVLANVSLQSADDLDTILAADTSARECAVETLRKL